MRSFLFAVFALTSGVLAPGMVSAATLTGSSVSGQMLISDSPPNYFDPANGFVPSGYGNSSPHGPNNVTIGSGVEFGYQDTANAITADFTGTGVTLQDVSTSPLSVSISFLFTDTLFAGATITAGSDNFPNGVTE